MKKSWLILGIFNVLFSISLWAELDCKAFLEAIKNSDEIQVFRWAFSYKKEAGACLNEDGHNAMHMFANYSKTLNMFSMLNYLAEADPVLLTNLGESPLMLAADSKNITAAQFLMNLRSARLNINQQDLAGRTALHWAVMAQDPAFVGFLLDNKASLGIKDSQGRTPGELAQVLDLKHIAQILDNPFEQEHKPMRQRILRNITIGGSRTDLSRSFSINQ